MPLEPQFPRIYALALRVVAWVAVGFFWLVYAPAKAMEEIEHDFYAKNEPARADRAHRILGQLLGAGERAQGPDQRQAWDQMVRAELARLCKDNRRASQYFHATRAISRETARRLGYDDLPLEEEKMEDARRQIRQMLDDLEAGEHEYSR